MKSYCNDCNEFTKAWKRCRTVTNLCEKCHQDTLRMLIRFIQVKTSEGTENASNPEFRKYSFHPKIRYHLADGRVFYAWIQVFNHQNEGEKLANFFIFNTREVAIFDNIALDTYQRTDNQKTELKISDSGELSYRGKYDYSVFQKALNNFEILDELQEDEKKWKKLI